MGDEWQYDDDHSKAQKPVPFPNVPKDRRVVFGHFQGLKFHLKFPTPRIVTRDGWIAVLSPRDEKETVSFWGASVRNPTDKDNGKIGRAIALHRAIAAVERGISKTDLCGSVGMAPPQIRDAIDHTIAGIMQQTQES